MDQEFADLLRIYDAQGIADTLQQEGTPWTSERGAKAQVVLGVLNAT
jgi:hypothetical protein